jgi:hypothetical protein
VQDHGVRAEQRGHAGLELTGHDQQVGVESTPKSHAGPAKGQGYGWLPVPAVTGASSRPAAGASKLGSSAGSSCRLA